MGMGFLGPDDRLFNSEIELDARKNINLPGVFAAGDCRRGQSLIVWGINEGRQCARQVDSFLMHTGSILPVTGGIVRRAQHDSVPSPRVPKAQKEADMAHASEEFKRAPEIKAQA